MPPTVSSPSKVPHRIPPTCGTFRFTLETFQNVPWFDLNCGEKTPLSESREPMLERWNAVENVRTVNARNSPSNPEVPWNPLWEPLGWSSGLVVKTVSSSCVFSRRLSKRYLIEFPRQSLFGVSAGPCSGGRERTVAPPLAKDEREQTSIVYPGSHIHTMRGTTWVVTVR